MSKKNNSNTKPSAATPNQTAPAATEPEVAIETAPVEEKVKGPREVKRRGYNEPTQRTATEYPILTTAPEALAQKKRTSSYYGRVLTFAVTGRHTVHLQENGNILREFINKDFKLVGDETREIRGITVASGNMRFFTKYRETVIDLKGLNGEKVSAEQFLKKAQPAFMSAMIDLTSPMPTA